MGQISRFSDGKYSIQLGAKIHPAAKYKIRKPVLLYSDAPMGSRPQNLLLQQLPVFGSLIGNGQMEEWI